MCTSLWTHLLYFKSNYNVRPEFIKVYIINYKKFDDLTPSLLYPSYTKDGVKSNL